MNHNKEYVNKCVCLITNI